MDKTDELMESTLKRLAALDEHLDAIARIEESFSARLKALEEGVDALFERQKELLDDLDHIDSALGDINRAIDSAKSLQEDIRTLRDSVDKLDLQGLSDALGKSSDDMKQATSKLIAAEARAKDAKKKRIGK